MRAVPIAPVSLPLYWPRIEAWVRRALEKAKADIALDDVRQCIETGDMQLWLAHDSELKGCCITELLNSARGKRCHLVVVAGDQFSAWAHLENSIAAWSKEMGCKRLTLQGRRGWTRRLKHWRAASVRMEKEI